MNKVFRSVLDCENEKLLTSQELVDAANFMTIGKPFVIKDFDYTNKSNRLAGDHCKCSGNGNFILLNTDTEIEQMGIGNYSAHGGKRWIRCVNCGCMSHL